MRIDRIVCLGDLVGYHADPVPCARLIAERGIACVRGNHDAVAAGLAPPRHFGDRARHAIHWTRRVIDDATRVFLGELPGLLEVDRRFLMVHASLHPRPNDLIRIRTAGDAAESLRALAGLGVPVCFFGHTHRAVAYADDGGGAMRLDAAEIRIEPGRRYLINPGSVGQPRDGDPRAGFATYDADAQTVRLHRVEFDAGEAMRRARAAGLLYESTTADLVRGWIRNRYHGARAALSLLRHSL